MVDWNAYPLDFLCEFTNGYAFKSTDYVARSHETYEVFRMGYIERGGGYKEDSSPVFVPRAYPRDLNKFLLRTDDVVIAMTDMKDRVAILGNTARIVHDNRFVLNQRVGLIRVKRSDLLNARFFYLYSNWNPYVEFLRSRANSGVQVNLTTSAIKESLITIPPLAEQEAIAAILGSLDDKIDCNRRMNETLEAMARAIFKDWFVDFGPTRAKMDGRAPYLAQEIWDLFPDALDDEGKPAGWKKEKLGQHVTNYDSKRVPVSSAERAKMQGKYPYHGAASVMDYVDAYLFDGIFLLVGEDGSVVRDGGLAVTQYAWGKIWVNNHTHVLQGKGAVSTEQLYMYFCFEPVEPYITGAVQPKLSQGRMNEMPFLYPGKEVSLEFKEYVSPFFAKKRACTTESRTLAQTRDLLLPKLMSGEIRVKDAEKAVESIL